ncbi:GyrI-like domain-containing protein [Sphingopyxis sp. JAI128]|uniref:GyrI-like domain-containing protein n=1 Tax=Sphingopyxis sp. JAI128 TaxID=2723066 RepID=UPI001614E6FF|nr:GyrI-like domain-containing protein [Sphingopyxis sp. JAI128]MBB6426902.1 effector-binding domain-containing protein [Sphingopyxis sp. JAI128]
MLSKPRIIKRADEPYVYLARTVSMADLEDVSSEFSRLRDLLGKNEPDEAGVSIIRYRRIDMERTLDVEFGALVAIADDPVDDLERGVLPAGDYASAVWTGDYGGLVDANAALLKWVEQSERAIDVQGTPTGDRFGCRLEIYRVGPDDNTDAARWQTEILFKLI